MSGDVLDAVRQASARVMERARFVAIDDAALSALATRLTRAEREPVTPDPAHHYRGEPEATLAYVVTLDAINFGSGWFPHLRKRGSLSGYFTVATALKKRFEARGPWSAPASCARMPGAT